MERWSGSQEPTGRTLTQIALHLSMCGTLHTATNLALDDQLIEAARKAGGHRSKKDAVNAALAEYVKRCQQLPILEAFGTIAFDYSDDYKNQRRRRSCTFRWIPRSGRSRYAEGPTISAPPSRHWRKPLRVVRT